MALAAFEELDMERVPVAGGTQPDVGTATPGGAADENRRMADARATPVLRCPFCTGFATRGPARGLMCHLTCRHAGAALTEVACDQLRGLERGVCCGQGCGALRLLTSRSCARCSESSPPRPVRVGDIVAAVAPGTAGGGAVREPEPAGEPPHLPGGAARDEFQKRVRALPSNTILHIPVQLRERHSAIVAGLLARMASGEAEACALEEARSKLLLLPCPRGPNLKVELAKRLALWRAGAYEELLVRAEEQRRCQVKLGHRRRGRGMGSAPPARGF